ncbi:MAG TPA: pyrroloquinoline quinone biosynthesis peptide chaperone PqqD [Terrimicrobiaceae bacterium]
MQPRQSIENRKPRLAKHARLRRDPLTDRPLLLYPEGVLELEETAEAILLLCGHGMTVAEIILQLAGQFEGSLEQITLDVWQCLNSVADRGLIIFEI